MDLDGFPPIPPALLAAITKKFPMRNPDPERSDRYVWIAAGEQRVIEFLRAVASAQAESTLILNQKD